MSHQSGRQHVSDILFAQTIKLIEENGPLEDSEAMRQALSSESGREEQLLERARILARRLKLDREMDRWRELAVYVWLALAIVVFLTAYGIAASLLGGGRSLNAVLAFVGVLGVHIVTLLLWLMALLLSLGKGRADAGRISFGNAFLRLLAWLPVDRGPHSITMARAAGALLRRAKLAPWAFGFISHSLWAAAFILVLITLWFGFSFREYRLSWETTILHADFFIRFVQITGWLPGLIGFPVPSTTSLLYPDSAGTDHRAWALWLVGCTFVYGFLVRVLLAALSWLMWQRGKQSLKIDTSDPYFRKLLARLEQLEQSRIIDREQRADLHTGIGSTPLEKGEPDSSAVVGFELPDEFAWPPFALPKSVRLDDRIAGTGQDRRNVLDRLAALHGAKLLVVCNQSSSPDRGTARFLREAASLSQHCAILLLSSPDFSVDYAQRWQGWLVNSDLGHIKTHTSAADAYDWLEGPHE